MSVRSITIDGESATPSAWDATAVRSMSRADAAAVLLLSAGVVILTLADPKDALCYLLAFPIWIVSRDLGAFTGAVVAVCAVLFVGIVDMAGDAAFGPFGLLARAAVFAGAVATGAQVPRARVALEDLKAAKPLTRLLTVRPEIMRKPGALSRRELEILEMIATGAKNIDVAERFVISQNTVKSHVSQILKKLSAANRTEAALRYMELYGHPSGTNGNTATVEHAEQDEDTGQIGATSAVTATVSAVPQKDVAVLVLQDGRDLEVPVVEPLRERVDQGMSAIVYFDQRDRAVGWYLPAEELGVDLRHWAA